MPPGIKNDPRG